MKKYLLTVGLGILVGLLFVTICYGATSGVATWTVTVKPGLGIVVSPDSFDFGVVTMGAVAEILQPNDLLPKVTNDGASNCKLQLVLDKKDTGWTFAGIGPSTMAEQVGLGFALRDLGETGAVVWDATRDKLETGAGKICDGIYFLGGGYDMIPGHTDAMEIRFGAPLITTNTNPTSFAVTVTALAM